MVTMREAEGVRDKLKGMIEAIPEANGHGIGRTDDGDFCVVINLEKKLRGNWRKLWRRTDIPESFTAEGVLVRWQYVGKIVAC